MKYSSLVIQGKSLAFNIIAYVQSFFIFERKLLGDIEDRSSRSNQNANSNAYERICISIVGPGGLEKLVPTDLPVVVHEDGRSSTHTVTVGYNVPGYRAPLAKIESTSLTITDAVLADDLCIVKISHFSVNYADVCIRWGLYESACQYVGYPIVPGFDLSGEVIAVGKNCPFAIGQSVFGFTMFGSYSTHVLVPYSQLMPSPPNISRSELAGIVAVAATALHSCALTQSWPGPLLSMNKSALIHSAAGGVGSMLIQMCRLLGYTNIVAVVGSSHKVDYCKKLGAQHVIDKSKENLWRRAREISPAGFAAVFDANGVETLQSSYDHLCRCGHLVTYGFHTNLPKFTAFLSPLEWIRMLYKVIVMPQFKPMDMVVESKSVSGFNLSFFADELSLIKAYMKQIYEWIETDTITMPQVRTYNIREIRKAHEDIQSGKTIGKLVIEIEQNS